MQEIIQLPPRLSTQKSFYLPLMQPTKLPNTSHPSHHMPIIFRPYTRQTPQHFLRHRVLQRHSSAFSPPFTATIGGLSPNRDCSLRSRLPRPALPVCNYPPHPS